MHTSRLKYFIFLLPLVFFILVRYVLDFNGLYGQDAHEYYRFARELKLFLFGGQDLGPFFWPINFPLTGVLLSIILGNLQFAMQATSALALSFSTYFVYHLIEIRYRPDVQATCGFVLLGLVFCPFVLRHGLMVMSDSLAFFFVVGTFYFFLRWKDYLRGRHDIFMILFASLAVGARYATWAIVLPPVIFWSITQLGKRNLKKLAMGLVVAILAILPNLLIKTDVYWGMVDHHFLEDWHFKNVFMSSFSTTNGVYEGKVNNLLFYVGGIFHPRYLWWTVPAIFLISWINRPVEDRVIMASLALYFLFICGIPEQNVRYILPGIPLVLYLIFPGCQRIYSIFQFNRIFRLIMGGLLLIQIYLVGRSIYPVIQLHDLERSIARDLEQYDTEHIYSFGLTQALGTYLDSRLLINLWDTDLDHIKDNGLVLFNEARFRVQWEGKSPMVNWLKIRETKKLELVKEYPQQWRLYRIVGDKERKE